MNRKYTGPWLGSGAGDITSLERNQNTLAIQFIGAKTSSISNEIRFSVEGSLEISHTCRQDKHVHTGKKWHDINC